MSADIFFPLGKMIGMVQYQTSFILSSLSWKIGSPLTEGAGRMKLSWSYTPYPFIYLEDIFGRREVIESFRFHHTLILIFLKVSVLCKILIHITDKHILHSSLHCFRTL